MSTEILDAVSRAVWVAGCCDDATYDEAVAAAKRGSPADASALLFNQEVAKAAISAMQSEISAERDAAVARAEQAEARVDELVAEVEMDKCQAFSAGYEAGEKATAGGEELEKLRSERDAMKAEVERLRIYVEELCTSAPNTSCTTCGGIMYWGDEFCHVCSPEAVAEKQQKPFAAGWTAAIEAAANYLQGAADDWRSSDCELPARKIEDEIPGVRALTPPADAAAALDRLTAQARAQGMREAAEIAAHRYAVCEDAFSKGIGAEERHCALEAKHIEDKILARATEIEDGANG